MHRLIDVYMNKFDEYIICNWVVEVHMQSCSHTYIYIQYIRVMYVCIVGLFL